MDDSIYSLSSLIKECEGLVITIVVNKDDLLFRRTDEIGDERVGIPHTSSCEEFFLRLLMRVNEEGYLFLIMLQAIFDAKEAIVNMLLEGYKLMIDSIALQQILLKYGICPRPEEDALR